MKEFVVLHVGYNSGNKSSGAEVAITKSLSFQQQYCKCALFNLSTKESFEFSSYSYENFKRIELLPSPFNKPSIVIFHELYRIEFLNIFRQCKKKGIPYIIIPHGGLTYKAQKQKKLKKTLANFFLFNHFFKNAKAIQFLSLSEKNNSKSFGLQETLILGNGIDKPKDLEIEMNGESFKILFIGRYDIYFKGLDVLLDACKVCSNFMRSNKIILEMFGIGSNEDESYLKNYVRINKLNDIIKINGPIYDEDKIKEYQKADYFIQTSRSEGQPMGILEALSYGLPIIVTPGTMMAEDTNQMNLGIVCSLDQDSVSNAIKEAFDRRNDIEIMSRKAKEFISKNFDGDSIAIKTIDQYKLLDDGGRS